MYCSQVEDEELTAHDTLTAVEFTRSLDTISTERTRYIASHNKMLSYTSCVCFFLCRYYCTYNVSPISEFCIMHVCVCVCVCVCAQLNACTDLTLCPYGGTIAIYSNINIIDSCHRNSIFSEWTQSRYSGLSDITNTDNPVSLTTCNNSY